MANALEIVKAHPVAVGVGALVIIGGVFILNSGGGNAAETIATPVANSDAAAGAQLQALGIQAQTAAQQVAASKEVALAELSTKERIAAMQSANDLAEVNAASSLGALTVSAQRDLGMLTTTSQAAIASAQINADLQANTNMYAALAAQAASAAAAAKAQAWANADIAKGNQAALVAQAESASAAARAQAWAGAEVAKTNQASLDNQARLQLEFMTQQLGVQKDVTLATLGAQTQQAEIAARPKGLFSWLFG